LKVTVDVVRNPVPLIVSACGVAPTANEVGDIDETAGTGLLAGSVVEVVLLPPPQPATHSKQRKVRANKILRAICASSDETLSST
jgi:hypothetical protein